MRDVLAQVDIFQDLSDDQRARLETLGRRRHFPAGSRLMVAGEPRCALHVIVRGRVCLERLDPSTAEAAVLLEAGPGEVVGELGVLDGGPCSDTVTALVDTETLEVDRLVLAAVLRAHPSAGTRLRQTLGAGR